jgi:uncharacterized protein involved in exopolysaccharide biosynthesis
MQIQPYQPQELTTSGGERIQVPGGSGMADAGPQPPSLLQVIGREIWKRKRLLVIWSLVTAVIAGLAVTTIAKPVYRGEGRLSYRPNYGAGGPRPIYTPPNIQSAVQILKANDVFEAVRQKDVPQVSPDDFAKNVHIEMSKQSEFIDVTYDHPSPAVAATVTNDLMGEGVKYFADTRVQSMREAVEQTKADLAQAKQDLERAKEEYAAAFRAKGIDSPEVELDNLKTALGDIDSKLLEALTRQGQIPLERKVLEAARDAPAGENDAVLDERMLSAMQAIQADLQRQQLDDTRMEEARINLKATELKERQYRPLVLKGIITQGEYDELVNRLQTYRSTVALGEKNRGAREQLQKQYDDLKRQLTSGKPLRTKVRDDLERLEKEEATIPGKIGVLKTEQSAKKKELGNLIQVTHDLGPKNEEILLLRTRLQELDSQVASAAGRSLDPHANDLRIHANAVTPVAPYSTNAPKLGLGIVGASALLFIGYICLFRLPKGSFTAAAGALTAGPKSPALVAFVPYVQKPKVGQPALNGIVAESMAPGSPVESEAPKPMSTPTHHEPPIADPVRDAEPVAVAQPEPVRALAERIVEEGVDRGGIVLFSPTEEQLRVAPAIGDLGRYFSERGDRVLVFDARTLAETPGWVNANGVDASVAGFLKGQADKVGECFVPTDLAGVEYSRVDLNKKASGVMEANRFKQLVDQMRERYSVVFLVGPPVNFEEDHPLLATLAEGMVLVTETTADPVEVHAYLDTLCQRVPARLYGTLAVPKSAA